VAEGNGAVFISYASPDSALAEALCAALERDGLACWLAPRNVRPGDFYADAIVQAINDCALLVLVLSQAAIESPHVLREVERASAKKRPVIALRMDSAALPPGLEYFLSTSQWIDAADGKASRQFPRLIEAVRSQISSASKAGPDAVRPEPRRRQPDRRRQGIVVALGVVVTLGLAYIAADKFWHHKPAAVAQQKAATASAPDFAPPPHSIAVLPFVNMSGDPKQDYFSDGISDELLNALARLDDLQVMARTSSFSFKGQNIDVATIAHKLNVGAILEGSVRRAGNTVRITVQLINAVSGFQMWSQTYDRNLTDVLKIQSEVAITVAQQLEVRLAGDESAKMLRGGTKNPDAYDAYLRGKQLLSRADRDEDGDRASIAAFDQAIALDPGYILAMAARAAAIGNFAVFNAKPDERDSLRKQARDAAERAVALAPELGETHLALAQTLAYLFNDYAGAVSEIDRALALKPGSAPILTAFSSIASLQGRTDRALEAARHAVRLDPENMWIRINLAQCLLEARRYEEALASLQEAKVLAPTSHTVQMLTLETLLASGQDELARQQCELPSTPLDEDYRHHCLAVAYHALGRQADAEREFGQLKTLDGDRSPYGYAEIYAQWGDKAKSLQWLDTAERLSAPGLQSLKVNWYFDPIRSEPRFKAIETRVLGMPQEMTQ
jgi:TolB-like protein/predicted Zn-dependent protease